MADLEVKWALVGGFAVGVRGGGRTTTDIDVVAAVVDDPAAEQLVNGLRGNGYTVRSQVEQTAVDRLATVRLVSPHDPDVEVEVDIIFASSGIEAEILSDATTMEVFAGLRVPVASRAHLLAMKVLSADDARPHDTLDIQSLLRESTKEEIEQVRQALQTISHRGFARGKALSADFDRFLARFPLGPAA